MKTMIAIPCMDTVHTLFMASMISLRKPENTEVAIASCSLVYEARHTLAMKAMNEGFDRVLWLDSDMVFKADLLERLSGDLDTGLDMVSAVYFTRKAPVKPCVYDTCRPIKNKKGVVIPTAINAKKVPDDIFEIEGCGFGAVMMTADVIRSAGELPFFPCEGFGEDLTFCRKVRGKGIRIWCDGRIQADHIGTQLINADLWKGAGK